MNIDWEKERDDCVAMAVRGGKPWIKYHLINKTMMADDLEGEGMELTHIATVDEAADHWHNDLFFIRPSTETWTKQ
jgi:hypothetical protein